MSHSIAVVLAAGSGSRAQTEIPKQYVMIAGKPAIYWSVRAYADDPKIDNILVVTQPNAEPEVRKLLSDFKDLQFVDGGKERTDSVRNALAHLRHAPPTNVFIHDAARPGLSTAALNELHDALERYDCAAPALKVVDALKRENSSGTISDVDRSDLYRVQTPQAFNFEKFDEALQSSSDSFVDDLSIAQTAGLSVKLTTGHNSLSKITFPDDFELVEKLMMTTQPSKPPRIGSGYDVHAFEDGDKVVLCGISIPHSKKLKGHSDADVAWHALTDAIFGALADGDIGTHFPPSDDKWKGAPSHVFLEMAHSRAISKGYNVGNVDITLICEAPKIKPHAEKMRDKTAQLLNIDLDQVSVKATTTEQLGFEGRKEGIACQATIMLIPQ